MQGKILSIQIGRIQRLVMPESKRVDFRHPFWTSAIFKSTAAGPLHLGKLQLEGDQQADPEYHGGPDNVILAYDAAHYPQWIKLLNVDQLPYGSFGENFTVTGFSDETVCIGDIWQIGDRGGPKLQVTQARQPCFKLARRLEQPQIVKMIHENSRGGWYLRVLHEGPVEAGMEIRMTERLHPDWTVARAVQTMYARKKDPQNAQALVQLPELSTRWKRELIED